MRVLAMLAVLSLDSLAAESVSRSLSATEFRDMAKQCLPDAPLSTLRAIAKVESAYNPLAISLNYPNKATTTLGLDDGTIELSRQPTSVREAVQWTKWFYDRGLTVSIGLMKVNAEHLPALGLSLEQAFEPCANLKAGWTILNVKYRAAAAVIGKGQLALHAAISSYNSGSLTGGFDNGYVEKVLAATTPASSIPQFGGLTVKQQSALVGRQFKTAEVREYKKQWEALCLEISPEEDSEEPLPILSEALRIGSDEHVAYDLTAMEEGDEIEVTVTADRHVDASICAEADYKRWLRGKALREFEGVEEARKFTLPFTVPEGTISCS